jgi:hypothetical protein
MLAKGILLIVLHSHFVQVKRAKGDQCPSPLCDGKVISVIVNYKANEDESETAKKPSKSSQPRPAQKKPTKPTPAPAPVKAATKKPGTVKSGLHCADIIVEPKEEEKKKEEEIKPTEEAKVTTKTVTPDVRPTFQELLTTCLGYR